MELNLGWYALASMAYKKSKVVVFNPDGMGARIYTNPPEGHFKDVDPTLVKHDPDLSEVEGVSPSHWKLVGGKHIRPLNKAELVGLYLGGDHLPHVEKTQNSVRWGRLTNTLYIHSAALVIAYVLLLNLYLHR